MSDTLSIDVLGKGKNTLKGQITDFKTPDIFPQLSTLSWELPECSPWFITKKINQLEKVYASNQWANIVYLILTEEHLMMLHRKY